MASVTFKFKTFNSFNLNLKSFRFPAGIKYFLKIFLFSDMKTNVKPNMYPSLHRCDTCEQSLASSSGYDSSSCSSDDCVTPDPCHRAGSSTADVTEVAPGGVQTEGAMVLLLSSTPCESPGGLDTVVAGLSISGHSLDSALSQISISKDDSDIDSSLSASCSPPSQSVYRSVLSQSVPTTQIPPKCQHRRRRRVTFSTEVTVAKVIDKSDQAEDSCKVTLVRVHTVKDKTKGH